MYALTKKYSFKARFDEYRAPLVEIVPLQEPSDTGAGVASAEPVKHRLLFIDVGDHFELDKESSTFPPECHDDATGEKELALFEEGLRSLALQARDGRIKYGMPRSEVIDNFIESEYFREGHV